jgi:septum formation protein
VLILASTSLYRQSLLQRLGLAFHTESPGVDEFSLEFETPPATALRLAQEKAFAVANRFPDAVVIGSDQVAVCAGERLDKPKSADRALEQLRLQRGRVSEFHTAVCVMRDAGREIFADIVSTRVRFRPAKELSDDRLRAYIAIEKPFDCAGSAKSEGLGIGLIESMDGPDPTALVGLPLIALTRLLRKVGIDPLQADTRQFIDQ